MNIFTFLCIIVPLSSVAEELLDIFVLPDNTSLVADEFIHAFPLSNSSVADESLDEVIMDPDNHEIEDDPIPAYNDTLLGVDNYEIVGAVSSDDEMANATDGGEMSNSLVFRSSPKRTYKGTHYTKFGNTNSKYMKSQYTLMIWVYKFKDNSRGWVRIIGKGGSSKSMNYGLWLIPKGNAISRIGCVSRGTVSWNLDDRRSIIPRNKWTHVASTFSRDRYHTLYINGQAISRYPTTGTPCVDKRYYVTIGGSPMSFTLYGALREARIYNYVLSHRALISTASQFTSRPTGRPTRRPTPRPPTTPRPTRRPTPRPPTTASPTPRPTARPTVSPITAAPSASPTSSPTVRFQSIITLLEGLIAEGNLEITEKSNTVKGLKDEVARLEGIFAIDLGNEEIALKKKNEANQLLDEAKGAVNSTCKRTSETVSHLEQEIKLFEKVIGLLEAISNGEKLVDEDQDEVKSFISLADQANPTKVKNVIALVKGLISTTNTDIAEAVKECEDAEAVVASAERVYDVAVGNWSRLVTVREASQKALETAQGMFESAEKSAAHRIAVVKSEIEALEKVLTLIKTVD